MNDLADVDLECLPEQQVERVRMLVVGDDSQSLSARRRHRQRRLGSDTCTVDGGDSTSGC
ncbi:hypothetical protein GCM10009682_28200 [Luedemannella flava]|uniref:Uncharacterized protein n=1 Tax=Luedemannella flava TaxID=349316 RepID=A0ABN2LZW3_9ACTN